MNVVIIDYGMCNLGSVRRAFEECCRSQVSVSSSSEDLKDASHIVLPGVGAFRKGMENLHRGDWIPAIKNAVASGTPLIGICLGMQLLAEKGHEGGLCDGLGLIPGEVKRLVANGPDQRIPHVGWNEVYAEQSDSPLSRSIANGTDFYFVHSYHFVPTSNENIAATTPYCGNFASVVQRENVFGVQFHPEKSQKPGFQLIKNFLEFDRA